MGEGAGGASASGDGGDLLVIQGAQHGRATAHAVANHAELARGDRNIASAKKVESLVGEDLAERAGVTRDA